VSPESVAVVIVTYNSRTDIERCLRSVIPHDAGAGPAEVVVVDNASTDDTVAHVTTTWPTVRVVALQDNRGFSAANNVGIRATTAPLVLLLNPDTVVPPGAIDALAAHLLAAPGTGIIGPRLVDAQGTPELSFGPMISPWGELRQKLRLAGARRGWRVAQQAIARLTSCAGTRDWVSGACLLIRRDALDAVGGLDERYFLYTEDVDLCASVRRLGYAVQFDPSVTVTHLRGQSAATNPLTDRLRRQSQVAFYEKHHPRWVGLLRWYLRLTGTPPHG
jgi:GT2 family glycosyltransferase